MSSKNRSTKIDSIESKPLIARDKRESLKTLVVKPEVKKRVQFIMS